MTPKFGSMGKPSPGWHIELHDDAGKPVGLHEEGRIAIRLNPSPVGLFREYMNNEEENRKSFIGGFYYTVIRHILMRMDISGSSGETMM